MELEDGLCIDTKRIFAEGFSMGGAMAYSMACSASDIVRAVAVHSGCPITACAQPHNTPVGYFMTHGTADQICAYPRYGVPLLQDFAKVNGCTTPDPSLSATAFDATLPKPTTDSSACIDFMGCKPGYPTRSCLFVGPHEWNRGRPTWVPAEVWSFFKQF
jgi:poly(3-hydroxybutyrate) depolymerase